jgi:dTDP-4-dehydrorhamnose 3,5-epimerase-like enzyme
MTTGSIDSATTDLSPTNLSPAAVRIDILTCHRDPRGAVFEPLSAEDIAKYRNVHVVITEPGAVRGNHRHVRGSEITSVVGPVLVRYREAGVICDVEVPAGEAWRFAFPAGVAHAYKNIGQQPFSLVSFNTEQHDQAVSDVIRDVLIES